MMRHLFPSVFEILRIPDMTFVDGSPTVLTSEVSDVVDEAWGVPGQFQGRLDLTFVRAGKDQPPTFETGLRVDRAGVLFFGIDVDLRASDVIRAISGPVQGTFELRAFSDIAQGYGSGHHREVQVFEIAQEVASGFPGYAE